MTEAEYLVGRLLLAMPGMEDPNFDHSVIAMIAHDEGGALGVGVGHIRSGITFHALLDELEITPRKVPDRVVLHGGPVEPGRGFVLHTPDWKGEDTMEAGPLGSVSASRAILEAIAEGNGPEHWLIALGYAGWGPGQLESEMRHHGWHAATGRADILFDTPPEGRWYATWRAEGIDPAMLVGATGTA